MASDASSPGIGQAGRLHVAGRSVPVKVIEHVGDALKLELSEEGWSLTDGDARLVTTGADGFAIIAGSVQVLRDGPLLFTPGSLQRDADEPMRQDANVDSVEGPGRQRGREQRLEVGQRREAFRVDMITKVTVKTDVLTETAQTINVSNTGCLLLAEGLALRHGQEVAVTFPLQEGTLTLAALVMRVDPSGRIGLMFHRMDAAEERRLSNILAERQREILRRR